MFLERKGRPRPRHAQAWASGSTCQKAQKEKVLQRPKLLRQAGRERERVLFRNLRLLLLSGIKIHHPCHLLGTLYSQACLRCLEVHAFLSSLPVTHSAVACHACRHVMPQKEMRQAVGNVSQEGQCRGV